MIVLNLTSRSVTMFLAVPRTWTPGLGVSKRESSTYHSYFNFSHTSGYSHPAHPHSIFGDGELSQV